MAVGRTRLAGVLAPILFFVGVLLVGVAVALPTLVGGAIKKAPADVDATLTANSVLGVGNEAGNPAAPARVWNACSVNAPHAEIRDADVQSQSRVVSVQPTDGDKVTLQVGDVTTISTVIDADGNEIHPEIGNSESFVRVCGDGLIGATVDTVSIDRETAKPDLEKSEVVVSVGGQPVPLPNREGYQYRLPFDLKVDGTYNYFDLQTRKTNQLSFLDEDSEIAGVKVYHYRTLGEPVDLSTVHGADGTSPTGSQLEMPASWWGITGLPEETLPSTEEGGEPTTVSGDEVRVSLNRFVESAREIWVDPKSGVIVKQAWTQHEYFASAVPNAAPQIAAFKLDTLNAQFEWNQDSINSQAQLAKDFNNKSAVFTRIIPIILGILGLLALAAGVVALLIGRSEPAAARPGSANPAAAPRPAKDARKPMFGRKQKSDPAAATDPHGPGPAASNEATETFPPVNQSGYGTPGNNESGNAAPGNAAPGNAAPGNSGPSGYGTPGNTGPSGYGPPSGTYDSPLGSLGLPDSADGSDATPTEHIDLRKPNRD